MSDKPKKGGSLIGKLFKVILALVAIVAIAFFGGAAVLPGEFNYERSTVIKADRGVIHKNVGDLKMWEQWGPWKAEDPDIRWAYSEKTNEVGSWTEFFPGGGTDSGKVIITKTSEHNGIEYNMMFSGEDAGSGAIRYEAAPDDSTKVTWTWKGTMGYAPRDRWIHQLMGSKISEMFDKGLAGMKARAETKK